MVPQAFSISMAAAHREHTGIVIITKATKCVEKRLILYCFAPLCATAIRIIIIITTYHIYNNSVTNIP